MGVHEYPFVSAGGCIYLTIPVILERLGEKGVGRAVSRIVDIPGSASFSALIL